MILFHKKIAAIVPAALSMPELKWPFAEDLTKQWLESFAIFQIKQPLQGPLVGDTVLSHMACKFL